MVTVRAFVPAGLVAGLLAVAALLVAGSWGGHAATVSPGVPATAWVAAIGLGAASFVLLAAASGHRFAVIAAVALLSGVGFVLRLGGDVTPAIREWTLFTVAATGLLLADRIGSWLTRVTESRWFALPLGAVAVAALTGVVVATAYDDTRVDARIGYTWPAPVVCVAASGLIAVLVGVRRNRPLPMGVQVYLAAVPALALYAFTRDLGAALLLAVAVVAVLIAAQLTAWRPPGQAWRWRTIVLVVAPALIVAAGVAGLRQLDLGDGFHRPRAIADLFGTGPARHGLTEAVLGIAGTAALVMVALALAVHLLWLTVSHMAGGRPAWSVWRVGLAAQVSVMLVVPALAAVGAPVPGSLGALPLASDGASFFVTVIAAGLITGSITEARPGGVAAGSRSS